MVFVNDLPPFGPQVPYIAAVVDLDEGPRMMTRVVDCEPDALTIGMRLRMRTEPVTDEVTMAVFAPGLAVARRPRGDGWRRPDARVRSATPDEGEMAHASCAHAAATSCTERRAADRPRGPAVWSSSPWWPCSHPVTGAGANRAAGKVHPASPMAWPSSDTWEDQTAPGAGLRSVGDPTGDRHVVPAAVPRRLPHRARPVAPPPVGRWTSRSPTWARTSTARRSIRPSGTATTASARARRSSCTCQGIDLAQSRVAPITDIGASLQHQRADRPPRRDHRPARSLLGRARRQRQRCRTSRRC